MRKERLNCPLSARVMTCQNVWVTVNCPATQTIEGERVGLSKVQSNILSSQTLVCLYWGCYDRFQEMTSGIRPDSQEMDSPALFFFNPNIFKLGPTDLFLVHDGVWCRPCFSCWSWFVGVELSKHSLGGLIRLAVSHSLEYHMLSEPVYTAALLFLEN